MSSSSEDESSEGFEGYTTIKGGKAGKLPLLAEDIELDDEHATVVFVFPRGIQDQGIIDPDAEKESPFDEASKIFFMNEDFYPKRLRCFDELQGRQSCSEGEYQELIRKDFLAVLQFGGMEASSSMSIDGDEIFLKVCLPPENERLAEVAEFYRYRMPVREDVFPPEVNAEGMTVPVYLEYSEVCRNKVEKFRNIDEVRLIMRWLGERVNLDEMRAQKILVRMFPGATYKQICQLAARWANPRVVHRPADYRTAELVREYYGERIAFFFLWFATYKVQLLYLAIATIAVWILRQLDMGEYTPWVPNLFVIYLTLWVVSFNETFKRKCSRFAQRWGMRDWDSHEGAQLSSYDEEQEGSCWKMMAPFATMSYVVLFAALIMGISLKNAEMRMQGDMRLATWQPYIVSLLMKVCGFVWGKMAIVVVGWENHRTEQRLDDSLAWTLASVKLFVALFPFVTLAFLESYISQTCMGTLAEAAVEVYKFTGWPVGTLPQQMGISATSTANITAEHLEFLDQYTRKQLSGNICISGCFPVNCQLVSMNTTQARGGAPHVKWTCLDYCEDNIQTQLVSFYFLQLVSAIIFLLIPIILTKASIISEILKVTRQKGNATCAFVRSMLGGRVVKGGAAYSLLQYQAKCHDSAAYEYNSWGGSFVEDFLDVAIGYSLLACFSQLKPSMVVAGVVCHFLIYRILAYRMLNVTCRPWPQGAEGIGIWQSIMDTIATLAVTCNVALSTFFMPPIKHYPLELKFLFFILAEKGLLSLRTLVGALVQDQPEDVTLIYDKFGEAEKVLTTCPLGASPKPGDFSRINLSL